MQRFVKTLDVLLRLQANTKIIASILKSLLDKKRVGRPVSKSDKIEDLLINAIRDPKFSTQSFAAEHGVSKEIVRLNLHKMGFNPFKKPKISNFNETHRLKRLEFCKKWVEKPLEFFEDLLITDSKIFRLDGGYNPQNDRHMGYII